MLVDAEGSRHVAMHHRREFKPLATFMLVPIFSKPPTSDSNRYLQSNHKDQRHLLRSRKHMVRQLGAVATSWCT